MSTLLLSFFPLVRREAADEALPAPVVVLDLAGLRHRGVRRALSALRGARHDLVRFVVTPSDEPGLVTIADLALCVARGGRKERVDGATGRLEAVGWRDALLAGALFAFGFVAGSLALVANAVEAAALKRRRPAVKSWSMPPSRGPVDYLRASFGLPAVGGSVGHTSGIVDALARVGLSPRVFACAKPVGIHGECEFVAVPIPATVCYPNELNSHRYSRLFASRAEGKIAGRRPAFLYQRYVLNDMSGVHLSRRLRIPLVVEYNGSEVWAQRNWGRPILLAGLSLAMEGEVLRHADLVVTVSSTLEEELLSRGIAREAVLFYPNCVDTGMFDPGRFGDASRKLVRGQFGLEPNALVATFVGTFGKWHGAEVLGEAARLLPDTIEGRRVQVLFVGEGPAAPRVRELLAAEIESSKVIMAGARPQSETPGILAASDVLASPQIPNRDGTPFFGSPTKLFEYMAMAKPVVASDLDQIGQILRGWRPGLNTVPDGAPLGIVASPGDPAALADALMKAFALSPEEATALGARARSHVVTSFRWEAAVGAVTKRLEELARRGRSE